MAKKKYMIGTALTAVTLGVLLGMFVSGLFQDEELVTILRYILIPVFSIFFIMISIKKPVTIELVAYGVAILLLFQAGWDFYVKDWNVIRTEIVIPAIISIIINVVSGRVKMVGAKKITTRQLGLGR